MKKFLPAITVLLILSSCKSSKDYLSRRNEDRTLYDIVKQLNKRADDELATKALPEVYAQLQQTHLSKIDNYKQSQELNRWEKMAGEYYILQDFYNALINSSAATKLVTPVDYQKEITVTQNAAAETYFQSGVNYLNKNNWKDARKAYTYFKKADSWIKDYNGSEAKMDTAKLYSIINVLISPVKDNSLYFNSSWSNNSFDFNSDNLPENLVRDLGGKTAGRYSARFYNSWQAERDNVSPDWIVDLTLREIDIPRPTIYNYTRSVSKKIETGKDSTGKITYTTVNATLHIQRQSFVAKAAMDISITEPATRTSVLFDSFRDDYNWQQEVASYSGDNRALSSNDWNLVNNRYNLPTKDDVLSELYKGIYPQVRNKISNAVDW